VQVGLGLLRSALASELSGCIEDDAEHDGRFVFSWQGKRSVIHHLVDQHSSDAADADNSQHGSKPSVSDSALTSDP
jgi:hypothetical protein